MREDRLEREYTIKLCIIPNDDNLKKPFIVISRYFDTHTLPDKTIEEISLDCINDIKTYLKQIITYYPEKRIKKTTLRFSVFFKDNEIFTDDFNVEAFKSNKSRIDIRPIINDLINKFRG